LRLLISAAILLVGVATSQAADNASCLASPTRACVLTMAVDAIEPVVAQKTPADTDRMLTIWRTAAAVIQSATDAGQFELAMNFVSRFDKSYDGVDAGPLFVAMKLAGREKDLPPEWALNRSFDMYTGPALVANGRDADFAAFVKSRKLSGYDLAGMQMAGDALGSRATDASASPRLPRRPMAGKAEPREPDQHHRPGRGFGDRAAENEVAPVANNRQIDIRSEA
jgi:hypothetical protein